MSKFQTLHIALSDGTKNPVCNEGVLSCSLYVGAGNITLTLAGWLFQLGHTRSFRQVIYSLPAWGKESLKPQRILKLAKWLWSFQISPVMALTNSWAVCAAPQLPAYSTHWKILVGKVCAACTAFLSLPYYLFTWSRGISYSCCQQRCQFSLTDHIFNTSALDSLVSFCNEVQLWVFPSCREGWKYNWLKIKWPQIWFV